METGHHRGRTCKVTRRSRVRWMAANSDETISNKKNPETQLVGVVGVGGTNGDGQRKGKE